MNRQQIFREELSVLGKIDSDIKVLVFGILGIIGLGGGIYLMFKKDTYVKANATIESQSQNCFRNSNQSCNTIISYVVDGMQFKNNVLLNQPKNKGELIEIYYDQNNANVISLTKPSLFMLGLILTLFSFSIVSIGNYYLSSKSKNYSVAEGIETVKKIF